MPFSYSEFYQAYEKYVPEQTQEDIQLRDDEHLALAEGEERRAALALISQPGYQLDDGALRVCGVCAAPMLRIHFHYAAAERARETA